VGGLEVRNADGEWLKAPYIDGTFVVNLGDMVPLLTDGLYHSTMHRVFNATRRLVTRFLLSSTWITTTKSK
jgi:isopenicillin N synthase-like dioxygenase